MGKIYQIMAVCLHKTNNKDSRLGIGKDGKLPWSFNKCDMELFKKTTTGKVVIMGRKTFDSLPNGSLPNRINIIITRDEKNVFKDLLRSSNISRKKGKIYPHTIVVSSIDEAIIESKKFDCDAYIIGGAEIYKQSNGLVDGFIVTIFSEKFECDTFLPENIIDDDDRFQIEKHFEHSDGLSTVIKFKRRY